MKVVVTGGAGYLGSVLSGLLLNAGHEVLAFDSLMHGGQHVLGLYLNDNFSFYRGDIRSPDIVANVLPGVDAVVHLAAIVGDPACAREPDLAKDTNLQGALQTFELCRRQGVKRFIFASTCSNYGVMENSSEYVTEESRLQPLSLYAETKVAVERTLMDTAAPDNPTATILRFATLFGISPRMRFDLTVNEFTAELFTNRNLVVYGEQFWRPYVHVRDAARAIGLVLEAPAADIDGQVFNVGDTGQNYQKGQLVELISQRLNHDVTVERVHKEEDPRDYRVSFEKIKQRLNFGITRTVSDGIEEIVDALSKGVISNFESPQYRN